MLRKTARKLVTSKLSEEFVESCRKAMEEEFLLEAVREGKLGFRDTLRKSRLSDWLKDVPCTDCGGRFPPEAMDFDHVRGEKLANVSQTIFSSAFTMRMFREEVAKCEVVCANCHRVRTRGRKGISRKKKIYRVPGVDTARYFRYIPSSVTTQEKRDGPKLP